jgi:uncharacterized protein YdeI (YjbR/CyaY-like superfamily)
MQMNKSADNYFIEGCGRCKLHATPQCKVKTWETELALLRNTVQSCGLQEDCKWGMPVYTLNGKNVLMITAFKESCVLNFFKGVLLQDEAKLLESPGENSQSARFLRFTDPKKIKKIEKTIREYIFEAVEVEKTGLKPKVKSVSEYQIPEEFAAHLKKNKSLKAAFEALTPGRRKAYLLHFASAKQSATRESRIQKCIPDILKGKGWNER